MTIIKRDDWIEAVITSFYGGYTVEYRLYPDGRMTQQDISFGVNPGPVIPTDAYDMLSLIADTTVYNLWAIEDGDMTL